MMTAKMNDDKHIPGFVAAEGQPRQESLDITRISGEHCSEVSDAVSIEEPLEIRVDGASFDEFPLAITMRTPGHDHELVAGFLFGEGIVGSIDDILGIEHCRPPSADRGIHNNIRATLRDDLEFAPPNLERHFYTTSSCGVCGKTSIEAVLGTRHASIPASIKISSAQLQALPAGLRSKQDEFSSTGGVHAAGVFDSSGEVIRAREDVGRHNALDKLIGSILLGGQLPLHSHGLVLSGRASFELVQKAVIAGIGIIAAIGSPSSLAIELARDSGVTLAGFVSDRGFNIYTHPEKII